MAYLYSEAVGIQLSKNTPFFTLPPKQSCQVKNSHKMEYQYNTTTKFSLSI